jgi:hypothetical protein
MNFHDLKKEELHPDLQLCYEKNDNFASVRHPLLYSVPHFDEMNSYINKAYQHKLQATEKALKAGYFNEYVWLHERPYRLKAFSHIMHEIGKPEEYWPLLSNIWIDSENIWEEQKLWKVVLLYTMGDRNLFMTKEERSFLKKLPEKVTVYRGHKKNNKTGLSWTLSREKALWFANRLNGEGFVAHKTVSKSEIFAYLNRRDEDEVLLVLSWGKVEKIKQNHLNMKRLK